MVLFLRRVDSISGGGGDGAGGGAAPKELDDGPLGCRMGIDAEDILDGIERVDGGGRIVLKEGSGRRSTRDE